MTKRMIQQRMLGSLRSSKMYKHSGVYISDFGKLLPFLHIIQQQRIQKHLYKTQKSIIYTSCKDYVEKYFATLHTLDVR